MAVIEHFAPFVGAHCETTTTGTLLAHGGLRVSEPMLYGIGQGLAYGVFTFASMPGPFIGGRPKGEVLTRTLASHLGIDVDYRQTRSAAKAWTNITDFVDAGQPVGVKLNCRYLDYFTTKVDFAGHYVAVYGYDEHRVFVIDTAQQGGANTTSRDAFEQGRLWKGPLASNALTWTLTGPPRDIDWPRILRAAIAANARDYLTPPIRNFGPTGIRKTAALIPSWPQRYAAADIAHLGELMEHRGTGGALFRNLYRNFLTEANDHLRLTQLDDAASMFDQAAQLWTRIAHHLIDIAVDPAEHAAAARTLLLQVGDIEERAANLLTQLNQ